MEKKETLGELLKKNRVKRRAKCILCGAVTTWFYRKSYYHRKEMFPICKKCKDEFR